MRGDNEIRIRISGRNKHDLLMEIVRALEELHQGFPRLKYDKLIPCNCMTCAELPEPHFFPLDKLRNRLANGRTTIECDNPPFSNVNILTLLDDSFVGYRPGMSEEDMARYIIYGDYIAQDKVGRDKFGGDKAEGDILKDITIS